MFEIITKTYYIVDYNGNFTYSSLKLKNKNEKVCFSGNLHSLPRVISLGPPRLNVGLDQS